MPWAVAAIAIISTLPALWNGLEWDDHLFRLAFTSRAENPGAADARERWAIWPRPRDGREWSVLPRNTARRNLFLMDQGLLPWWTAPEFRLDMFRPISFLAQAVDFRLWPNSPVLMHAHSLLWFGAVVLLAGFIYREVMGAALASAGAAALAALLYAIDDAHSLPAGFISNRHILVAGFFGLLAFRFHYRWREGWRAGAWLAPMCLALALLSYEAAVAVCGFIFAYALFLDRGPIRQRALSLAPYVATVAAWRLAYLALGLKVVASEVYVDPARSPFRLIPLVAVRAPVLLTALWASPPSDIFPFLPGAEAAAMWISAVLFLAFVTWVIVPVLREERTARFWAVSMFLAVLPVSATVPNDRLLLFPGIAGMALIAQFLLAVPRLAAKWTARRRKITYGLWAALLLFHGIAPLPVKWVRCWIFAKSSQMFEAAARSAPVPAQPPVERLVIVNVPLAPLAIYFLAIRANDGLPLPRHLLSLASGVDALEITRDDAQTLTVRPRNGFLAHPIDRLVRDAAHPFAAGQGPALSGVRVEVTALNAAQRPAEAVFRFDKPLEDPSLRWLCWTGAGYRPFRIPAIHETVRLAPEELPVFAQPRLIR